jgi:hypothetical protein
MFTLTALNSNNLTGKDFHLAGDSLAELRNKLVEFSGDRASVAWADFADLLYAAAPWEFDDDETAPEARELTADLLLEFASCLLDLPVSRLALDEIDADDNEAVGRIVAGVYKTMSVDAATRIVAEVRSISTAKGANFVDAVFTNIAVTDLEELEYIASAIKRAKELERVARESRNVAILIASGKGASGTEIAKASGLTRAAVSQLLSAGD